MTKLVLKIILLILLSSGFVEAQTGSASILNPPDTLLSCDGPYQLVPLNAGGTWTANCGASGTGGCLSTTGLFYPSQAMPGPNIINHAISGSNPSDTSIVIVVSNCIEITSIKTLCSYFQYLIRIEVTFSELSPDSIVVAEVGSTNPTGFFINDSTWTSDWILNGTAYAFISMDAANPQNSQTFIDFVNCDAYFNLVTCGKELFIYPEASIYGEGIGSWTCLSTSNLSFNPSADTAAVTIIIDDFELDSSGCEIITTHTFQFISINDFGIDTFIVDLIFSPDLIAFAGEDHAACGLETTMEASFSDCNILPDGYWLGPGSFNDNNNPTSGLFSSSYGTFTYVWMETNGICNSKDSVSITFLEAPHSDAGYDDTSYTNSYQLNAESSVFPGIWTGPSGAAFSDSLSPFSMVEITMPPGQPEYTVFFTWTLSNECCSSDDDVTVTFIDPLNNIEDFESTGSDFLKILPNRFVESTTVKFNIRKSETVQLYIVDIWGIEVQQILLQTLEPGIYSKDIRLDHKLPGVYFCVLTTKERRIIRRMILMK